jgi:hypothetical protein
MSAIVKMLIEKLSVESTPRDSSVWWQVVQSQLTSLRCSIIEIVVHDSREVQIERNEEFRFGNGVTGLL